MRRLFALWRRHFPVRLAATTAAALALVMSIMLAAVYVAAAAVLIGRVDARLAASATPPLAAPPLHRDEEPGEDHPHAEAEDDGEAHEGAEHARFFVTLRAPQGDFGPQVLGPWAWLWPAPSAERVMERFEPGRSQPVVASTSLHELAETLGALRAWLAGIGGAGVLFTSLVAFLSARRAFVPIAALTAAAEQVATAPRIDPDTLRRRVPEVGGDVSLERLAGVFNQMLERLHGAFATQARFVDDASHELRTPIGALRADLEVALRRAPDAGEDRAALQRALAQASRLGQLADDLLALARFEHGMLLRIRPGAAVGPALEQALADVRHMAEAAGVDVTARWADDLTADVDPDALTRLVVNLLQNSIRAAPRGQTVTLHARREAADLVVVVEDRGPGMPPEAVKRLFEPFYRAPETATEGTGLGMAIVRAIVERHHGRIAVDSHPGRGTRIQIRLPRHMTAWPASV